jgi:hypothetical protein
MYHRIAFILEKQFSYMTENSKRSETEDDDEVREENKEEVHKLQDYESDESEEEGLDPEE